MLDNFSVKVLSANLLENTVLVMRCQSNTHIDFGIRFISPVAILLVNSFGLAPAQGERSNVTIRDDTLLHLFVPATDSLLQQTAIIVINIEPTIFFPCKLSRLNHDIA